MDVHQTLYLSYITNKIPLVTATVTDIALLWRSYTFHSCFFAHSIKLRDLPQSTSTVSLYHLPRCLIRQTPTSVTWSEPSKIYCHVIVTHKRSTVEQSAPNYRTCFYRQSGAWTVAQPEWCRRGYGPPRNELAQVFTVVLHQCATFGKDVSNWRHYWLAPTEKHSWLRYWAWMSCKLFTTWYQNSTPGSRAVWMPYRQINCHYKN